MKSALFGHFLRSLLAGLTLGFFCQAVGMDEIFEPTGKTYNTPNWNVPDQAFSDREHNSSGLSIIFSTGKKENIKNTFKEWNWLKLNQPCIAHQLTSRINEFGGGYMYPLQFAIEMRAPLSTINAILELGSPKSFKGYDPFKHILNIAATKEVKADILMGYTRALMRHGMSPAIKTAGTSGTEQAIRQECQNNTAIECTANLVDKETRQKPENPVNPKSLIFFALWAELSPSSHLVTPAAQSVLPGRPASVSTNTTQLPTMTYEEAAAELLGPPASVDAALPEKLSWHDTISQWCNKPKSNVAKTTACIFALAAVAVATKLLYNHFLSKKAGAPTQIIITNKSGTIITVGYKTKFSNDLTSITLNPEDVRPFDLNTIKLNLIVTEEETAKSPLPINLERYKTSVHQKNTALHITIYKNSGLRSWLSEIPYSYTATWK